MSSWKRCLWFMAVQGNGHTGSQSLWLKVMVINCTYHINDDWLSQCVMLYTKGCKRTRASAFILNHWMRQIPCISLRFKTGATRQKSYKVVKLKGRLTSPQLNEEWPLISSLLVLMAFCSRSLNFNALLLWTVEEEVFISFTQVKIALQQWKNSLL